MPLQQLTYFDGAVCVILDINLNDVSGIELRHRLKANGVSGLVIYITGNPVAKLRCLGMHRIPYKALLCAIAH